jgi:hypothetical protein
MKQKAIFLPDSLTERRLATIQQAAAAYPLICMSAASDRERVRYASRMLAAMAVLLDEGAPESAKIRAEAETLCYVPETLQDITS